MTTPSGDSDSRAGARIYRQVAELEQQLKRTRGPDSRNLRSKLREKYVELILTDFEVSEERQVANTLWHSVYYSPFTELRNRVANHAAENQQANLKNLRKFLGDGIQFYESLIRKLKRKYGVDNEVKCLGIVGDSKRMLEYQKISHRLHIHLGDLARYMEQYPEGAPDFKVPAGFYYKAISLWPPAGHPHNQLAVLATYMHNEFVSVYQYCRGIAAVEPVDTATTNLNLFFQKTLQQSDDSQKNKTAPGKTNKDAESSEEKTFFGSFVKLLAILHLKKSLDKFAEIYTETVNSLEKLPSLDLERLFTRDLQNAAIPATGLALVTVQITSMIICAVNATSTTDNNTYADALQYSSTVSKYALTSAFKIAACFLSTCAESKDPPMLAGSLVFMEWLTCRPDLLSATGNDDDERLSNAKTSFWKESVTVFNSFGDVPSNPGPLLALWEDRELQGFKPLASAHEPLDFSTPYGSYEEENQARIRRFIAAGKSVAVVLDGSGKGFVHDKQANRFFLAGERREWKPLNQAEIKTPVVLPSVPVAASFSAEQDEEEEVIVFRPVAKSNPVEQNIIPVEKSPERLPTPQPQVPASTVAIPTPITSGLEAGQPFALLPPLPASLMDGLGSNFPPPVTSGFDTFQPRYGGYAYGNGIPKEPAFPQLPDASSSMYQDLLFQLQNASSLRDVREAAFARQGPVNQGLGATEFLKQSVEIVKEEPTPVLRPPPGFGPIPSRKVVNTPPPRTVDPRLLEISNPGWDGYNPSKLSAPRPLFSTDFGIWSNGNSSSNSYPAPISSAPTSYPFPGMGPWTTMQKQNMVEQPVPILQQQYGGWKPEAGLPGMTRYEPQYTQQLQQTSQDIEQQILRQCRPPDPFVS